MKNAATIIGGILVIAMLLGFGHFVANKMLEEKDEEMTQLQLDLQAKFDACLEIYPFYASLNEEERVYYVKLCAGFEESSDSIVLKKSDSKSEIESTISWIDENYREVVYEQPDYFWVDANSYTIKETSKNKRYTLSLEANYTVEKDELEEKRNEYNEAIDLLVRNAAAKEYLFDAVLYVYDSILHNTDYDHELAEQTKTNLLGYSAYGCIVEGKTVCSGYTMAFTSVMQKLGIPCGAEFDNNADKLSEGSAHVWNYCKLDTEYYYFDLTWDDTGFDSDELREFLDYTHDFFAISEAELSLTHENLKVHATAPDCVADTYNYYSYKDWYCGDYSFSKLEQIVDKQRNEDYIVIKFATVEDREEAEKDLFENKKFYQLFPNKSKVHYIAGASGLQLYLFF